jgi:hypothetical protein
MRNRDSAIKYIVDLVTVYRDGAAVVALAAPTASASGVCRGVS